MTKWISVKDRLPKLNKIVQVCWPSGYDGVPLYAFGARIDDGDGWMWGIKNGFGGLEPTNTAFKEGIEVDDDYPVQFWAPLLRAPKLKKVSQ